MVESQVSSADDDTVIEIQIEKPSQPTVSGMFCTPSEAYGEARLSRAYWTVISELKGDGLMPDMLTVLKPKLLIELGDSRRFGRVLEDALGTIQWDWPRWHSFAKRVGYSTVSEVLELTAKQNLHALMHGTLKADLVALAASFDIQLPKSITKSEMIKRLMAIPIEKFEPWIVESREHLRKVELQKLHRHMGEFIASRIASLANGELRYEQLSDPEFLQLRPYWRFVCSENFYSSAPKKCRDMDQMVLPAAEAMRKFPKIPCNRLDCQCRIATQRSITGDDF